MTTPTITMVPLEATEPDEAVVVIDVLRAFTVVPWMLAQGAERILAVDTRERALALRKQLASREQLASRDARPGVLLAGEEGGRRYDDFDLGNSPTEVAATDLTGRTIVQRTTAGTQGLVRAAGSGLLLAAGFVTAEATVRALRRAAARRVTFVITGESLGRDGDEDRACAELIAARLSGQDPAPGPYLARVAPSDHGRFFAPGGADWAPPADLTRACELDRFDTAVVARQADDVDAIELRVLAV